MSPEEGAEAGPLHHRHPGPEPPPGLPPGGRGLGALPRPLDPPPAALLPGGGGRRIDGLGPGGRRLLRRQTIKSPREPLRSRGLFG